MYRTTDSPSKPKYSWSMFCSSLKPGHFFHTVPTSSPILETIYWVIRGSMCGIRRNTFPPVSTPWSTGLRSSAMDSRSPGSWQLTLPQHHTLPGEGWTCSTWTQKDEWLFPHNDATSGLLAPLTLLQPSLDAWLTTFSAVMILQYKNHCLLGVGGVQTRTSFILAQLRIFIPRRPLITKTSARSVLIGHNVRITHAKLPHKSILAHSGHTYILGE